MSDHGRYTQARAATSSDANATVLVSGGPGGAGIWTVDATTTIPGSLTAGVELRRVSDGAVFGRYLCGAAQAVHVDAVGVPPGFGLYLVGDVAGGVTNGVATPWLTTARNPPWQP